MYRGQSGKFSALERFVRDFGDTDYSLSQACVSESLCNFPSLCIWQQAADTNWILSWWQKTPPTLLERVAYCGCRWLLPKKVVCVCVSPSSTFAVGGKTKWILRKPSKVGACKAFVYSLFLSAPSMKIKWWVNEKCSLVIHPGAGQEEKSAGKLWVGCVLDLLLIYLYLSSD